MGLMIEDEMDLVNYDDNVDQSNPNGYPPDHGKSMMEIKEN